MVDEKTKDLLKRETRLLRVHCDTRVRELTPLVGLHEAQSIVHAAVMGRASAIGAAINRMS